MSKRPDKPASDGIRSADAVTFERLFMALPLGAALLAPDLTFLAVNREMRRLTGYAPEELIGLALPDIMSPTDRSSRIAPAPKPPGLAAPRNEAKLLAKSGETVWVRLWLESFPNEGSDSAASVCLMEDVTGQKRMDQSLYNSRLFLEKTFAELRDAVLIVDADTVRIMDANPAAAAIFGYERGEMIGRTTNFLHVDDQALERFREALYPAVADKGYLFLPEFSMRAKSGRIFPTEHSVIPIEDGQGRRRAWVSVVRDVSKAVADRRALRENTDLLKAIIDNSFTAVMVRDMDGRHALVNNRACELLNLPMEKVAGKNVWEVFPRELAERFTAEDRRVVEADRPMVFEQDIIWQGERQALLKAKFPLRDQAGKIHAVGSVITDITRLKQAERELKSAHGQLEDQVRDRTRELEQANRDLTIEIRARKWAEEELIRRDKLLEAAGACSRLLLACSDFDEAMDQSLAILGQAAKLDRVCVYERVSGPDASPAAFALRRQWTSPRTAPRTSDLIGPDARWDKRIQALAQGRPIHGRLCDFFGKDQAALAAEGVRSIMLVPVRTEDSFWGFIDLEDCRLERIWRDSETTALMAAADIFGGAVVRRRTEQELVAGESLIRAIVDSAVEGILTVNESGGISSMNPAAECLFGREKDTVPGRDFTDLLGPDWRSLDIRALADSPGDDAPMEVAGVNGAGRVFPMELAVSSFVIEGRTMYTCQVRDITERKKVEQLKREFLSVVSHELRTPLTSISGAVGLLAAGKAGPVGEQARTLLDIASQNSRRLLLLIEDILDIQKIESGKAVFDYGIVDLHDLVRQTLDETAPMAHPGGVVLEKPPTGFKLSVRADPHRLKQVLGNLLSNAFKFSPPDKPVRVRVAPGGLGARVEVRDHGPGVPELFHDHIFERFAQADTTDSRGKGGTGLGLSIAREIIHRHGGRIGFENKPDGGAAFYFELPPARKGK